MIKKTKFYVGIALLVEAVTFLVLFILIFNKKRSLSGAILAIAAAGGITGAILVYRQAAEEFDSKHINSIVEDYEEGFSNDSHDDIIIQEVPVDDTVDETEFI